MKPATTKARPDPISMRLPEELKTNLSEAARAAGRSLNSEIRIRLEWSLAGGDFAAFEAQADARSKDAMRALLGSRASGPDPLEERVTALEERLAVLERQGEK